MVAHDETPVLQVSGSLFVNLTVLQWSDATNISEKQPIM
jgi:hypothetical protein